jgi:intracellular sulfur oxidation DsrE/DsrF family protein
MKRAAICAVVLLAACIGFSVPGTAGPNDPLPIPDIAAAKDIPGAHEMPDPDVTYKVVFDIKNPAPKPDDVHPGLVAVARYFNTLAANGVPATHRKIVVVFHGVPIFLDNDAYRKFSDGHDNPNVTLIQSMKKAGVDFRVCGQELLARKMDPKTVLPEVQVDLWAMTSLTNLQLRGYIRVPLD